MTILVTTISLFSFILYSIVVKFLLGLETDTFDAICGYGFGCSYCALFCRISGGIFTKGSDISCDIIGKLENRMAENDSQTPSSIADNIGDLVGDLAGSVLDLITLLNESFCAITIIISYSDIFSEYKYPFIMFLISLVITSQLVFIIIEYLVAHYYRVKFY
jgi:K(+)-stimulated pyrophosphate-energized sodium pump